MIAFQHAPVDSHLIHKEHLDDVLISNMRSELPTWLSAEEIGGEALTDEDRNLLARHYVELPDIDGLCCAPGTLLVRRSVSFTLPLELADEPGFEFITQHYKASAQHLVLQSKYLPEEHENLLMARFVPADQQLSAHDRHQLSAITRRLPCNERSSRFSFNMINDLQNYFFYRKHHEHVPGLMLIEVARQAVYAQYYNTSLYARGEITLTLSNLDCQFEGYVESNYPVTISVETTSTEDELRTSGKERRRAEFFQNGRRVATIEIAGLPIKMKLFKRLRIVRPDPEHWFVPVKAFAPSAVFFCSEGKRLEGQIKRVARNAMEVSFDQPLQPNAGLDFVLAVDGLGYIDGRVWVEEMRPEGKRTLCRLSIEKLAVEAERRWLEAIKNFSHVETGAGVH